MPTDSHQQPPEPTPPSGGSGGTPVFGSSPRDADLIKAARAQARPGTSSSKWAVIPPSTIPGYDLIKEIHRGGQGVVYQAIQKTTKRRVAVKVMKEGPFASSRDRARFEREVEILAQLNHPNIVSIIDSGVAGEGGSFFYVMDYVAGDSLDVYMSHEERTLDQALRLFARICDAVNAAHLKGIIHRDLKPSNIRVDQAGEPHILDFGLAKVASQGEVSDDESGGVRMMTMTGQFVGSLPWASPEQAEGRPEKIDVRTDVYSLGVILYQMLTGGKFPYEVIGTMRDVLDNILRAAPARPSTIRRQVNDEVETIVLKSLSKERERRYQNAGELARDVRSYLSGLPIEAKRDSAVYQLRVMARRHKWGAGVAAGFLVLIAVFGVTMSVLYGRAEKARNEAVAERQRADDAAAKAESERTRAQENFESARALAHSLIFDFSDGMATLRGATAVRKKLLTQARAYMEKLSAQAGDDPTLLREVADAADKVGDIEGGLNLPKIGTPGAAAQAYERARQVRDKLLERFPDEARSHADAAMSRRKLAAMLYQSHHAAEASEECDHAVAEYDRAVAIAGITSPEARPWLDARAALHALKGDAISDISAASTDLPTRERMEEQANAQYDAATAYWNDRLRDDPTLTEAARWINVCRDKRIDMSSIVTVQQCRAARELMGKDDAAARALLDKAAARYTANIEQANQSISDFEKLSSAQPANAELRRDLWLATQKLGWAHLSLGQLHQIASGMSGAKETETAEARREHALALDVYIRSLEIIQKLADSDEANIEARRDLAAALNQVGDEQRELGQLEAARATFDRSLAIRRELMQTDPIDQHRLDLGVGLFKRAQVSERLGDAAAKGIGAPAYRESLALYREAGETYKSLARDGVIAPDARESARVAQAIARVEKIAGTEQ